MTNELCSVYSYRTKSTDSSLFSVESVLYKCMLNKIIFNWTIYKARYNVDDEVLCIYWMQCSNVRVLHWSFTSEKGFIRKLLNGREWSGILLFDGHVIYVAVCSHIALIYICEVLMQDKCMVLQWPHCQSVHLNIFILLSGILFKWFYFVTCFSLFQVYNFQVSGI